MPLEDIYIPTGAFSPVFFAPKPTMGVITAFLINQHFTSCHDIPMLQDFIINLVVT